ncbi:TonB-dependent siderophore receptor [Herbaspirillum rubrisubalbicans Os34]|uniref:TonB-dependent siderophore receptor n=1 Tax=Herbaspirillum rubrisubalbicans Os34 TaxID=1235827 RepID=A0A6M3ZX39_9BURK|nr:TonB-dependent receptor [Herbaspirillum rubrisubalbicans]QJQ02460.1 TonB-dependent siderophore receptor [Herbaspirillum rubrisubalbicans Os34]
MSTFSRAAVAPAAPPRLRRHPLAAAACLLIAACALTTSIQAQEIPAVRSYAIAAGPLDQALYSFARSAGVTLSFEPELVAGMSTRGLAGNYPVSEGLSRLLTGTGLEGVAGASGGYRLRKIAGSAGDALPVVSVTAERSASTEGTASYAPTAVTVASKIPMAWKDVPNSVTVITRQQMDDQNMTSVEDALRQSVGVTAIPYGDGTAYFQSRGYASEVQYDGLPANNSLQYLRQFNLAMYDRVEVLRGPSGLLQGSGEPAGSVNLVRKRPQGTPSISGSVSGGSWSNYKGDIDISRPLNEEGTVRGRVVAAGQDGAVYKDKGHNREALAYGILEVDLTPRTTWTISAASQNDFSRGTDYGPGVYTNGNFVNPPRSAFFGVDWGTGNQTSNELFSELTHHFDDDWVAKASYIYRHTSSDSAYGYVNGLVQLNNTASYILQGQDGNTTWQDLDVNLSGSFKLLGRKHQLLVGANYAQREAYSASGSLTLAGINIYNINIPRTAIPLTSASNTYSEQYGLYAQTRLKLADPLTLLLGGRESWYASRSQALLPAAADWKSSPSVNNKFTPYAGLVYELTPSISLYSSYSDIFSPQTQLAVGNTPLAPRTGQQYEVGAKGVFLDGKLNASLAAFRIRDNNRAVTDPDNPSFYVSQGKVQSKGWEAEVSGSPKRGLDLYAGYTRLDTVYLSDPVNQNKVFSPEEPRHTLKLWTKYQFQDPMLNKLQAGFGARVMSQTNRGVGMQGGYSVFDAMLGYRIDSHWLATLQVTNLFDKSYYARMPARFYSVYGEPRNITLTLRAAY